MSYWVHHCGEHANNCYAEIRSLNDTVYDPSVMAKKLNYYGPFLTKEEAIKAAERRGLTLTSLQDLTKK